MLFESIDLQKLELHFIKLGSLKMLLLIQNRALNSLINHKILPKRFIKRSTDNG